MIMGVFLHTALTYSCVKYDGWPLYNSKEGHLFFDWLFGIIHIFRMPIFFIISGFFGSLLFYEKSPVRMIINRTKRILLPFIVFLLLLTPLNNIALKYSMPLFLNPLESSSLIDIIKSLNIHNFFPTRNISSLLFILFNDVFNIFFLLFKFVKRDFLVLNYFNKTHQIISSA